MHAEFADSNKRSFKWTAAPERDREAGNRVTTAATMAAVNGSSAASKVEKFEHEGGGGREGRK